MEADMQTGLESGLEFLDPRSLDWEQRYAMRRRAVELAHEERARFIAGLVRRLWSGVSRTARPVALPQPGGGAAAPCRS
jgi:hypothetical protein